MKPGFQPIHPGEVLKNEIQNVGVTTQIAADSIGITRPNLSLIINGHASVSSEMAVRLSKVFGTTAQFWMNLQVQWELSQVNEKELTVKKLR